MSKREHPAQTGLKRYVRPTLEVYGTLLELTATVGFSGAIDGGDMDANRTS